MLENQQKLKERYVDYRIRMKSKNSPEEKKMIKKELSNFLESVASVFGQEVADNLTKKK